MELLYYIASFLLNLIISIIFALYCKETFSHQKNNKKTDQVASYFRISDYVKSTSVEAYSFVFGLLNGALLFSILEIIALTPGIIETINPLVIKLLTRTFGEDWKSFFVDINSKLSLYFMPSLIAVIVMATQYPQLNAAINQFRRFAQRTVGFRDNAQALIDDAYRMLDNKFGSKNIEAKLESTRSIKAPRPRELLLDEMKLAKYQILYFATYDAPEYGLDEAIRVLLEKLGLNFSAKSEIQLFNTSKIIICSSVYFFMILLFAGFSPGIADLVPSVRPYLKEWPEFTDFFIELSRWSFQISIPFVAAIALYELQKNSATANILDSGFKLKLVVFQLVYGLIVGLAFHILDIWRSAVGKPPTIDQYVDIYRLIRAIAPCVTAPFLFWLWTLKPSSSRPVLCISIIMSAAVGGFMLFMLQALFEKIDPEPRTYIYNEFLVGCVLVGLMAVLWYSLRAVRDSNQNPIASDIHLAH